MKKLIATVVVTVTLIGAGCESSPTISAERAGHLQDGGVIFGSGHRSGSDSTSANTQNADATTQDERGGVIFGSGH